MPTTDYQRRRRCPGAPCHPWSRLYLAWLMLSSCALGKTIRYHTYEEDPPGTVIGTLADELAQKGSGEGGGGGGERSFRLMKQSGNNNSSRVRVRERDGQLSLGTERLDREQLCGQAEEPCLLAFDVVSLEAASASQYRLVHVELEVRDINDHAPRFPAPLITLEVSESAAPGTRLPLDLAVDLDVGTNGIQSFAVSPNSHFGLEAQSRADGLKCAELVLLSELDREAQASYRLELVAKDGGSPARSGTATVSVRVLDANDNAPTFPHGALLTVELPEDAPPGSLLLDLDASDPDEGANGQLLYSWGSQVPAEARQLFALDPLSGRLTLQGNVDYELQRAFELDVQASDRGATPLAASCKVVVRLLDVNDNAPVVTISALSGLPGQASPGPEGGEGAPAPAAPAPPSGPATVAYVSEAAPAESLVALVSTSDSDAGANGQVRCALLLAAPHAPFALQRAYDASYVVLTTGPLDRERVAEYNLTVVAEDLGSPPAKTVRRLTVRLADENDHAPRFVRARSEVAVAENNPPGAYLAAVQASDPDLGPNGKVTYRLLDGQVLGASIATYVSVDAATGAIYALRTFNYEVLKQLELSIQASDGGSPALSSAALVKVRVLDQNDNAPVITQPPGLSNGSLEIAVSSRAARDSLVAHVQARDADEGANAELRFAFQPLPPPPSGEDEVEAAAAARLRAPDLFAIHERSGAVALRGSLAHHDAGRVYPLLLTVSDQGRPSLSATATVRFRVSSSSSAAAAPSPSGFGPEAAAEHSSGDGAASAAWDVPLIAIAVLAGSCTLLLAAIIAIATTCNRRRKEKKARAVPAEPLDDDDDDKAAPGEPRRPEGGGGGGGGFMVRSVASKSSSFATSAEPSPSPASEDLPASEHSREGGGGGGSLYDSQSRLRGGNLESYTSTPSYSKETGPPVAIWKGHSFNTIAGREAEKFSGKDSGKGDSDFNDSDSDISGDALKRDLMTHMQNGLWACTAECKILGHSDRCWSPSCGRSNPHSSHPKTQLSTFGKSTSLPRDSLRRDNYYHAQLPKTLGLQSVYEKILHRDYDRTMTLLSPPHPGRLPDLQEISVPLYQAPSTHYLGSPPETSQKV